MSALCRSLRSWSFADQVRQVVAVRSAAASRGARRAHADHTSHCSSGRAAPAAPATRGSVGLQAADPHAGEPLTVARFETSIGSGAAGAGVITTPATASPAARAASTVSSVWLIVPRPVRPRSPRQPQVDREVAHQVARSDRHQQAADALGDQSRGPAAARAAPATPAGSIARRRAAASRRDGGPKPVGATCSRVWRAPVALASSSSGGEAPGRLVGPGTTS